MVLIRARRTKLVAQFRPAESEDSSNTHLPAQVRARQEQRRRAALYDVSSPFGKRLPSVCLQPADARMRKDLLRLTQQRDEQKSVYEDDQDDCKHREHLNFRPPMDQINKLRDLHTTVAKDNRGRAKLSAEQRMFAKLKLKFGPKQYGDASGTKTEWRLGYSNNVDTGSRAGVGGTFEPRDGARERILDTRSAPALLPASVAVAYPVKESTIPPELIWREREEDDEDQDEPVGSNELDDRNQAHTAGHKEPSASPLHQRQVRRKPWCPASSAPMSKSPTSSSPRRRYRVELFTPPGADSATDGPAQDGSSSPVFDSYADDGLLRFPIRSVEPFEPIDEADEEFVVDARCARRQRNLLSKVADTYARVRARVDRMKDPHFRYELPVEDGAHHPRSYRLGLDAVPSTKPQKPSERPKFRPKSAGTSLGFQTGALGPKDGDLLTPDLNGAGKVAGAKRRPHSASITYFKHATVFCMGPPTPSKANCVSAATDFRSVVAVECKKRQRERDAVLGKLAARGLLHSIPLAQVFARLRREGLLNIDRRLQRSVFERMPLDDYMSACGCLNVAPPLTAASERRQHSSTSSPMKEAKRFYANLNFVETIDPGKTPSVDASPSLVATRNALVVTRQQFHLALEAFNLSSTDVNLLFSALDVTVSDRVHVWDAMCAVEGLQHEHTALRRARVQQLQAPPSREMDFFRRLSINQN
jgi:hypothetical protein